MPNRKIIFLGFITALALAGLFAFSKLKPSLIQTSPKTWEITLSYNTQDQVLSLKKITVLEKQIRPDYRVAADSPYQLQVLDKSNKVLYLSKIHITEELSHSIWTGYPVASSAAIQAAPTVLETTLFIPYFESGSKIQIEKDGKVILTIDVKPQKKSFNLVPTVFAQTSSSSGGPLKVVILYDGNFTLSQFQQQAQTLISAFQAAPPYGGVNPPIFEFIQANSINHFDCAFNPFNSNPYARLTACSEQAIKSAGYAVSSQAAKIIVLADTLHLGSQFPFSGLTNDIGGDISLIGTNPPGGISFTQVAIHEFLGHAVGELYDRYTLTSKPGIKRGIKSNCSDSSAGETFWGQTGAAGPYPQPCDSPNLYAPGPNDCPPPPQPPPGYSGPVMTSGGSRSSIMGACNPNAGFDSVEQAWIRTQIIPRYQAVSAPTPIPTPIAPQAANDCSFNLSSGQIVRGGVSTQLSAVKANTSYYLSLVLLNSKIGNLVGAITQSNTLTANWNSLKLYQNGSVTLRCLITDTALGGNNIFSKDVVVNVQN